MLFERIFRHLHESKIRYAVIGGIAVNLHGYNRLTGDLDIILSMTDENLRSFVAIANQLRLVPRLPLKVEDFTKEEMRSHWIHEKNMKVFSLYNPTNPLEHIDVKIDKPEDIEKFLANAQTIDAGDIKISVVSIDDLIELKKQAGRERDLVDIRALERIRNLDG